MSEIWEYIGSHWTEWLFALVTGVLGMGYRSISAQLVADRKKNEAIAAGVESLLRDSIVNAYNKYNDKGFCPIYAKESVKKAYQAYHNLGGNDIATQLYRKLLEMPEEARDEQY